jgi:predicted nucleic acid-binding protein
MSDGFKSFGTGLYSPGLRNLGERRRSGSQLSISAYLDSLYLAADPKEGAPLSTLDERLYEMVKTRMDVRILKTDQSTIARAAQSCLCRADRQD